MEKEPKISGNLEELLRQKGYKIEPIEEEDLVQCGREDCFEEAKWFMEGSFYCPQHKEGALKALEEVEKGVENIKLERERVIEERRKQSGFLGFK